MRSDHWSWQWSPAVSLNWGVHFLRESILFLPDLGQILMPALGAGLAVFMIRNLLRDPSGHGVPEVIHAVLHDARNLKKRMILSRFFGSLFTVGTGNSAGLEGPQSVLGCLGAVVARWLNTNERRSKLLLGYGVAGALLGFSMLPNRSDFYTRDHSWRMVGIDCFAVDHCCSDSDRVQPRPDGQ